MVFNSKRGKYKARYRFAVKRNMVEAIDISLLATNTSIAWVKKASMTERRYSHGCHAGVFERQEGIFVAGGRNGRGLLLASAEFYNPATDMWKAIGSLKTARANFPMTMLGQQLIVSGGEPGPLTSVETWNGTSWVELNNLKVGRSIYLSQIATFICHIFKMYLSLIAHM